MWNLNYVTNELIYKTETDSQTRRIDSVQAANVFLINHMGSGVDFLQALRENPTEASHSLPY